MLGKILDKEAKDNKKTLESIDKSLKALLKVEEKSLKIEVARERKERRSAGDFMLQAKKNEEKKKKEVKEKKEQKDEKAGAFAGGLAGSALSSVPWKAIATGLKGMAVAIGPFALAAGAGVLALKGLEKWAQTLSGRDKDNNKVRTGVGQEMQYGKSAPEAATVEQDKGASRGEHSRRNGAIKPSYTQRGGNETAISKGFITPQDQDKERQRFLEELDEIDEERKRRIKKEATTTTSGRKGKGGSNNVTVTDEAKKKSIEDDYESEKEKIRKRYDATFGPADWSKIQARQSGGPITVPGSGSGDKVPMMLKPGSFVLNRNASSFLRRQTGGEVPTMLEPGELVYLNSNIQRFQTGGQVTHPDTGSGFQPDGAKDQSGRPVVLSEGASEAFSKMMKVGGVKGGDVASSKRSVSKNAAVGGVANSAHLGGNAIDIHGLSKAWMIENSEQYGWKRNNYMNDSWHWDYTGKGSKPNPTEGSDDKLENKKVKKNVFEDVLAAGAGMLTAGFLGDAIGAMGMGINPILLGAILGPAALGAIKGALGIDSDDKNENGSSMTDSAEPGGEFGKKSLIKVLDDNNITNKTERAMFLSQMAHESGNFRYDEEIHDGSDYEGRSDLGNNQPGDGKKFKGRGYIQITGRDNYKKYGDLVGQDLLSNPELASDPNIAAAISVAYWKDRVDRKAARKGDVETVTRNINGGLNGLDDRNKKFKEYQGLALQNGGEVPTMLEPGEMVFPSTTAGLKQLNSGVPRFQNGGEVFEPDYGTPQVVVINAGGGGGGGSTSQGNHVPTGSTSTAGTPSLPSGPSMAGLSDIINRVSWSNVF